MREITADAQLVSPDLFERAGLRVPGTLTVMMLDTKRTFDGVVERYASSPDARARILRNKLYHYVSTTLSGTREYMAMEKLHEVRNNGSHDLIVLDTPPTANALDFLDAPVRLVDALDSQALRWFGWTFRSTGRVSLGVLARSAALAVRGVSRFTGGRFLQDVAEFLGDINDLFGGLRHRARQIEQVLRSPELAYVLVTSPAPMAIREVLYFSDRLSSMGMSSDAFVVNRVHLPPACDLTPEQLQAVGAPAIDNLDDDFADRLREALNDERRQAEIDAHNLLTLDEGLEHKTPRPIRVHVPAFARDVHDIAALDQIACALMTQTG